MNDVLRVGDGSGAASESRRTTTRAIANPRLEIGCKFFSGHQIGSAHIHTHEDERSEFRSASVTLNPPFDGRWDYHEEVRIYEDDDLVLTGLCSEAKHGNKGRLHLKLWGSRWLLDRTALQNLGTFGMSSKENFYWSTKLSFPSKEPIVEGLEFDDTLRPFLFAIPLKNLESTGSGQLLTTDTGIASHDYETVFKPVIAQFEEINGEPAWLDENPKVFGMVFANNLLQADFAARERAEMLVGIINLALRTGMSHFETRYRGDTISFNAETTLRGCFQSTSGRS